MFESEERRIARRIKDFIKSKNFPPSINIMLRDGRMLDIDNYRDMVNSGRINPQDAYVYFGIGGRSSRSVFYYPFLIWYHNYFSNAYLSKLGFYYEHLVVPATGLKYVAITDSYEKYLTIEVSNLDTVANNTNLPNIVFEVLDGKLISGVKMLTHEEYIKISRMFVSQLLFAGHNVNEALDIIMKYYDDGDQSFVKEAARIAMDYDRIFDPYTVYYDMDNWKEVDCWSIKC